MVPKTYNGTGQIMKSQVFDKKKGAKKEEIPNRMKSPTNKKTELIKNSPPSAESATNTSVKQ